LSTATHKEWAKAVKDRAANMGAAPVLFFAGKYKEEADRDPEDAGFLHLDGDWLRLAAGKDGNWEMIGNDTGMKGTWDGGTDMLLLCIQYILTDPSPEVPTGIGCQWADKCRRTLGKLDGRVTGMQAVDLAGDGRLALFVAAESGDRLYLWDAKKSDFQDVTAAKKLASRSQAAAWADFNADGRLDLASWDGKALTIWLQGADGTFPAQGAAVAVELKGGCLGLDALDVGGVGGPGLLVSTKGPPVLLKPSKDGALQPAGALDPGGADVAALGAERRCLMADLDGDGFPDVLQLFEKGSLVYVGKGPGAFAPARKCAIATGKGASAACAADLDMDGQLDVYTVSEEGCRLWWNRGKLDFADTFRYSGEMSYTAGPGAVACQPCDINADGRQDMALFFSAGIPHIFFNRGFRSFGKSLNFTDERVAEIKECEAGQQAGSVEDFNGDGAQDLALAAKDGTVYVFLRKVFDGETPLYVRAALPGAGPAGPVTVTGWEGKRCLGAWNVAAGSPGAVLARPGAGEIRVRWQFPGGKPQEKVLEVEGKPARLVLKP